MDYTIRIGGEAGQGLQVIGSVLAKLFSRHGLHVFTHQDYMSRIRGGHNYYQIRFADKPVISSRDKIDILLALDLNTISTHQQTLSEKGVILYDADSVKQKFSGTQFVNVPFVGITEELGIDIIMANSVAVGAVLGILDMGLDLFDETIADFLHGKGAPVIATNRDAAQAGFDFVHKEHKDLDSFKITVGKRQGLMLINGSGAIGLGALLSGCKFYAAYPMTPSTGIMNYLASKAAEYNLVVEQAEDEISAINMVLGASYGGVRAMTGTSGGGFALMTEGISLAGITETPVVIAEVQRPGPATGLPTRTEQGDLLFVLYGGHGEFPRVVFTPGTPEQAFYLTNKAFHLAEKYQIPVFIQSDQYLADAEWTYEELATERLQYEDFRLRKEDLDDMQSYHRYAITDNGISPLAVPGESIHTVVVDSDEHDEQGHIIEDAPTRVRMVDKRLHKKLLPIRQEIEPPQFYGPKQPEVILVGFGSTYGILKEAVDSLSDHYRIGMLHFSEIFPFPLLEKFDFLSLLEQASLTICIENNATSQFARLMRAETGFTFKEKINKYDGRPFTLDSLLGELNGYLRGL
jgi:2-oxoglutarate ferredoxin oxidoreductase subunit alpha